MVKGLGNIQQLIKQAEQMSQKMARIKEELANREETVTSGGGMVEVTVNGKMEVVNLKIDTEIIKEGDVEMIQDLVRAAVNEAFNRIQEMVNQEMHQAAGGLPIPGLGI